MHKYKMKKRKNKYIGSFKETESKKIGLPFTIESLMTVLGWGHNPEKSEYTHQDIAHWCCSFHLTKNETTLNAEMSLMVDIALDVDAQWEMYLGNTYSLEELQKLDFSTVQMPIEWFRDWRNKIKKA